MANDRANDVLQGREGSYALLDVIGKGAYGTVYKGIWREVGRHVAIKRVSRSRLSPDEETALQTEIKLFRNLNHKHIVNYIEAVDDPSSSYLDIVMEFVEGGSLFNLVQSIRRSRDVGELVFEEHVVAELVHEVVLGLRYLHHQGVVHRDIKGANILVTKERHVKLADFGVSSTKPGDGSSPIDVAGSPYWMAPEIITLTGASTASDIWSLGCTVIELLTGLPPYHEFSDVTALFRIVSDECPPLPPNLSSECEEFLRRCFNKDVKARASADELLEHRWLALENAALQEEFSLDNEPSPSTNDQNNAKSNAKSSSPAVALDMFEEGDDEDFDDLDFGEDDTVHDGSVRSGASAANSRSDGINRSISTDFSASVQTPFNAVSLDGIEAGSPRVDIMRSHPSRRLSIRDDPFKDLMDDPEVDRERERIRKQKELWELVKMHASALGKSEDVHVAACDALIEMFKANPEQRYYLIYDPGLLPIIEVLESGGNGSTRVVEAMLRVTLSFLDDSLQESKAGDFAQDPSEQVAFGYPRVSNIREDLCLAGFLPVVMRYCRRTESFEARILAAQFLEKMLELERALHMFIACRGFSVFVEMLEPDVVRAGELARIALGGIDRLMSMENQRHKRDFCRRFAWCGLLHRIVDGMTHNMDRVAECKDADDESVQRDCEDRLAHVNNLAKLLQTFAARADPMVKAKMTTNRVLHAMIRQITNHLAPQDAIQNILCCVRDLSRDPQTHSALQDATAIETLVQYLSVERGRELNAEHFIVSSLHNLCTVSPLRQEVAAKAGVVPHLQKYIRSKDFNVQSLCIDIYSGLACAGHATRVELGKHKGVDFYVDLLVLLCVPGTVRKWQARVLQSLSEWLDDSTQSEMVEQRLVMENNRRRVCESLALMRVSEVEGVLEPYLKMVTNSERVNRVFGESEELVTAMVRWLEGMYGEGEGGDDVGPRVRLLLLRTLLAHARLWRNGSGNRGVIGALQVLLTQVVLVSDEAITVREQATALVLSLREAAAANGSDAI